MSQSIRSIAQGLIAVKQRYEKNKKLRKTLKDFKDPIELRFLANNTKATIIINGDQGMEVKQSGYDSAPVKISFESEQIMMNLMNKKLRADTGYRSGKMKVVSGSSKILHKLLKLLF
ncbi:MAG: hypothetical protein RBG13Loki_3093 [Promethearchaeota archaeon CR_4]|nr:MAG: hypothetical protein RBG13Loki_3093 [Candidatus Lokiarchaeota archaeon CR_4]